MLLMLTLLADLALGVVRPALGWQALRTSASYLVEMVLVLPPIFVLIGMLEVWVPRKTIVRNVGPQSGLRGLALSVFAGSAAAGPLYGAFPVAESLLGKGCSVFNACVLLCTWAAVKIPMLMMEVKFLGWRFSLVRLVFTLPAIVLISWLVDRFTPRLGGLCGADRGTGEEPGPEAYSRGARNLSAQARVKNRGCPAADNKRDNGARRYLRQPSRQVP